MKKLLAVLIVVALALVAVSVADAAWISNTKHNLSSGASNSIVGNLNEICIYCHTPHNGVQAAGQPLWNRFASTMVSGYSAYTSATLSGTPTAAGSAASALCFSCHDGITSINSLRNRNGASFTGNNVVVRPGYAIANDGVTLTNDHPIGMPVPAGKSGYQNPVQLAAYLVSSNVECSTCHAVHGAGQGATLFPNLLRMDNTSSLLCLDCHVK